MAISEVSRVTTQSAGNTPAKASVALVPVVATPPRLAPVAQSLTRPDPAPAPLVPPAATVAESVLLDPTTPHPVEIVRASPEIRSPGLQPGAHPSPDTPPR